MAISQDFPQCLQQYLVRRFGENGTAGDLARAVNEKFSLDSSIGLKRQTINNWLNGTVTTPREWWQVAATTCVLCATEEEADLLLSTAGLQTIAAKRAEQEQKVLMDEQTREKVEAQVVEHWAEKSGSSKIIKTDELPISPSRKNWTPLLIGVGILFIGVLTYSFWPNSIMARTPNIVDDFSSKEKCASAWDFKESQHAVCEEEAGVLRFDLPVNDTGDWSDDVVDSARTGDFIISRVNFTAALDPASTGRIGIGTDCHDENTWLSVYIDGSTQNLAAAYGQNDAEQNSTITVSPVTLGEEHTIDLVWKPGGIEVTLDGVAQERTIPCSLTRWLNIFAGGDANTQAQGYVTAIRVWD